MQTNKGRFKCKDEAQAVWNVFKAQVANRWFVEQFEIGSEHGVLAFDAFASDLYINVLINGSIYDEDGRIEDKDVAHDICLSYQESVWWFNNVDGHIVNSVRNKEIRGTIFY
jgi:hypothetical protein